MKTVGYAWALVLAIAAGGRSADLQYKDELLKGLVAKVPEILKSFDPQTGRFGSGIWICGDQHPMYPLAVAYTSKVAGNPYYQDPKVLEVIVKAAGPLLANMDQRGQWMFTKKDGSTWGRIWMPWTYSRWIRTFQLVGDRMPPEARQAWADALVLGYTGISKSQLGGVHNIATHHAMGLYIAGKTLDRPEWCKQASEFMKKVMAEQSEGGYWSEGGGPVVLYDFVYVDALGTYYAASGDESVLPALEKAAVFHQHFTYPGGQCVETVDQRNPFHESIEAGNVGFTFSPAGRAYLKNQWAQVGIDRLDTDLAASLLVFGQEGPAAESAVGEDSRPFVLVEGGVGRAATLRKSPWFVCLSAYVTPVSTSRWIQDRQNFVSVYHEKLGLVVGGGNTKLQPGWSNFTVGDTALLAHKPGDQNPVFLPKGELHHVPSQAVLQVEPQLGLELTYGSQTCRIGVEVKDDRHLVLRLEVTGKSDLPTIAHLTLLPRKGEKLVTGGGKEVKLGDEPIAWAADQVGGRLTYAGCHFQLPDVASVHWPALPHNPYRIDGRAVPMEGRIEIRLPFTGDRREYDVTLEVAD
ncbi:MAG: hypothetical protein ACYC6Y_29705 [Thermoguttaceae bacterium]